MEETGTRSAADTTVHIIWTDSSIVASTTQAAFRYLANSAQDAVSAYEDPHRRDPQNDALLVLLPLLIVLSTFLFLLLLFLLCVILLRRRRGIALRDHDGPIDLSREEFIEGEGGFDGVESRWLESVSENQRREYLRAKGMYLNFHLTYLTTHGPRTITEYQLQYPPNSTPTDITLSQFLSIQEKGVSAWSFDPDYEMISSLLVHARTELTFLPDPSSATSVQSNLPLPKLNEVYYWEVKMFDLPESTNVAIGLATKPYPAFRLPGHGRFSVAYHSNGDKSYNYPFTAQTFGTTLKEGDVLGVGYRPRSGTVFFTRNGRKMEDAFVGLNNWNLFPTIGADGPCSLHVNLGQAGFVFIEANVKKWGLAPSVGTLAPPPAYGSERGSILLEAGAHIPSSLDSSQSPSSRRLHRTRRPRNTLSTAPVGSSPLRDSSIVPDSPPPPPPLTPPPPITPIEEEAEGASAGPSSGGYVSPTDFPYHVPNNTHIPPIPPQAENAASPAATTVEPSRTSSEDASRSLSPAPARGGAGANPFIDQPQRQGPSTHPGHRRILSLPDSGFVPAQVHTALPHPQSPSSPNPPTPNVRDIHLQALNSRHARGSSTSSAHAILESDREGSAEGEQDVLRDEDSGLRRVTREETLPPAYSPLDAYAYSDGVQIDLPADIIAAALDRGVLPSNAVAAARGSARSERRRSRRHGHGNTGSSS